MKLLTHTLSSNNQCNRHRVNGQTVTMEPSPTNIYHTKWLPMIQNNTIMVSMGDKRHWSENRAKVKKKEKLREKERDSEM